MEATFGRHFNGHHKNLFGREHWLLIQVETGSLIDLGLLDYPDTQVHKSRYFNLIAQQETIRILGQFRAFGIRLSANLNFGDNIESKALTAAKRLGILNKVKRYFTPGQLLTLYKAEVRLCMEYCSHMWDGSAIYQLAALESVARRAKTLITD